MVEDGAFIHKIDYGKYFLENLNLEGHPNLITGSKVTAILLNGWILPFGGVASGRVCAQPAKQACHIYNQSQNTTPQQNQSQQSNKWRPNIWMRKKSALSQLNYNAHTCSTVSHLPCCIFYV